jgi:nitroimidazol reductase NimA-like FMN-containing flavoprotein (pyridoxamine 5'-phosphate oxidase superfamily)
MCVEGTRITIYFHGGPRGYKTELLAKNPQACVEGDIFIKVEPTEHGITTRYESIIGFGKVEQVTGAEIITGLQSIVESLRFFHLSGKKLSGLCGGAGV